MSEKRLVLLLWTAAFLFVVAGLGLSLRTYTKFEDSRVRFQRKIKEYEQLQALEAQVAGYDMAVATFNNLDNTELASLKDLLKTRFPGCNPDDVRESRRDAIQDWLVHDVEASLNDVLLSEVMAMAVDVEKMRPPWVLQKCVLTASSCVENKGNAVLSFTGVSK